jgi:hypothetical protein
MNISKNYVEQGEEIVTLRKLMQIKAGYIAECCGKEKGNYSKMEKGYSNNTDALGLVRTMYKVWVQKEILDLDNRIEYLKSLVK